MSGEKIYFDKKLTFFYYTLFYKITLKELIMKIKVYVENGYRIINVNVHDSIKNISQMF